MLSPIVKLLYSNKNFESIKIHCLYSQIDRLMIQDWPNLDQSPLLYVLCPLPYTHTHTTSHRHTYIPLKQGEITESFSLFLCCWG